MNTAPSYGNRIGRISFAIGLLYIMAFLYLLKRIFDMAAQTNLNSSPLMIPLIIALFLSMFLLITLLTRRMHDLNLSRLWLLIFLVPTINILFLVYLMFRPGDTNRNIHGTPQPPTANPIAVFWITKRQRRVLFKKA